MTAPRVDQVRDRIKAAAAAQAAVRQAAADASAAIIAERQQNDMSTNQQVEQATSG